MTLHLISSLKKKNQTRSVLVFFPTRAHLGPIPTRQVVTPFTWLSIIACA